MDRKLSKVQQLLGNRGVLALIDQGLVSGTNFVTSLIVGRYLGKESLGILFITIGIFTVLQCIAEQLIHAPYLVRAPHFRQNRVKQYAASSLIHNSILTVVGILLVVIAAAVMALSQYSGLDQATLQQSGNVLPALMLLLAALLPGMMLREFTHNFLHNQLRQAEVVLLDMCVSVLQLSALFWLLSSDGLSLWRALLVIGGTATLIGFTWLPRLLRRMDFRRGAVARDFAGNWPIGKWTLASYLIGSSAPTVLPWFLAISHGTEATGLLVACLTLTGIAQTFLRGISKYMAPQMAVAFAKNGHDALLKTIHKFLLFSLLAMTAIAALLAIGGQTLVQFAYGGDYEGTTLVMQVLAIGCWLQAIDMISGNGLLAISLSDRNFWADCARCLVTVVFAFALIPTMSALGVAIALVGGMVAGLVFRIWFLWSAMSKLADADTVAVTS